MSMYYRVSRPPRYVILTPILFNEWERWAKSYEEEQSSLNNTYNKDNNSDIRPIGSKICPNWVLYEFVNLEKFYQHYTELLNVGESNGNK